MTSHIDHFMLNNEHLREMNERNLKIYTYSTDSIRITSFKINFIKIFNDSDKCQSNIEKIPTE